jgi:hypothetical protein
MQAIKQGKVKWQQALNAAIVARRTATFQAPSVLVLPTAAGIGDTCETFGDEIT